MYGVSAFRAVGPTTFEARRLGRPQQAAIAAAVAVGYYVGVQIGIGLSFPPTTSTSVLWPPNSVLTAALLLLPVRYWWLCLAGALPVHVLLELAAGYPPRTVAALFLTNSLEALIAAGGVRFFGGAPTTFNTFRSVAVFIGAAVLAAPLLSSFADAAVLSLFQGQSYWDVWSVRSFSNSLTELSVVPMIVLGVDVLVKRAPLPSPRRLAEMGLLAAGLIVTAVWIFGDSRVPGFPPTPSVLVLPFYFWAALRFGVGGLSAALFATVFVATFEARLGHRPFEVLAPAEGLKALQMYLVVMAIPLMCAVGLLEDRRRGEAALHARLRFESVLGKISGAFVRQPLDAAFKESLRHVGEFCDADYAGLLQIAGDELHVEWQWNQPAGAALLGTKCTAAFPWAFGRVLTGETVVVDGPDTFPTDASKDRESFGAANMRSAVVMPLLAAGRVEGALSLAVMGPGRRPQWIVELLQLAAEVLANASARRKAELELNRERQKIAAMARLSSMGELTASLAHQLNQPLTGIRSNAEAAQRFIDSGRATLAELREIMLDIVDDNQRASDVIWRVRELLGRSEWSPRELDANALVRDVTALMASDALLRNVRLQLDLAPGSVLVRGNRVDLEQVLLNVITNAMDAVAENPVPERMVVMQTACGDDGLVHVTVRDRGAGLPDGVADRIFEPFVTTKANGMGMGLAVARSLVDNHGGSIRAANQPGGGAVVTISIPGSSATS
jgi:signal transduction histidine kinase/integral membrane sensor domain MASE1